MSLPWLAWLACAPSAPSSTPPAVPPAVLPTVPSPLAIDIQGLVPRYEAALADPPRLDALSLALVGCAERPSLQVRYEAGEGTITLSGDWTGCRPALRDDEVDLEPLVPAASALARYRDALAVGVERRLGTFALQLALGDCRVQLAGQLPPDGTSFSSCVQGPSEPPCPRSLRGVRSVRDEDLTRCVRSLP